MKTLTSSLMDGKNYKQNKVMRIDYINAMAEEVYLEHENNDLLYGDSLRLLGGNEERFRKQVINNMYPTSEQEYQADLNAQGEAEAELARQEYEYQQMLRERANLDNMNKAQETLEEAAANLADPNLCKTDNWIAGAKWQQERIYTEEDLKLAYFSAIGSTGEGWNGEYAKGNNPDIEETFGEGFIEWFEQFKKK